MSNYRNPYLKDKEKRFNFVPHLKIKKVKQVSRTKVRQVLRSNITLRQYLDDRTTLIIQ